jgi:dTDP-4-dehydrorhamnose reductase
MKWAVLGHVGMLGQELMSALSSREVTGFDRAEFDITDIDSVKSILSGFDVVVNCAAWTAVDDAEVNEAAALAINGDGPRNVAKVCNEIGAKLVQISTDYVFSGDATTPYAENSEVGPKSAYGRTKLAGEVAVRDYLPNGHYIVRTAWLYGEHGPNFIKTMINLEKSKDTISVVNDQIGQPTWTKDLASQVINLVDSEVPAGTYHATSSGQTTWFGLTQTIFELIGADPNRVLPTTTEAFPRPAPRPAYSVLGHENWRAVGMNPIRAWDEALIAAFSDGAFRAS